MIFFPNWNIFGSLKIMTIAGAYILEKNVLCSTSIHTDTAFYAFDALYYQVTGPWPFFEKSTVYVLVELPEENTRLTPNTGFFQVDESPMFWYPYNIFTHKIIVY